MGYMIGAGKYWIMGLLYNPINLYIFGGSLLWALDVMELVGSDNVNEFAVNYVLMEYGIPSSFEDAIIQLFVGATVATIFWFVGSIRYATSKGWQT